MIQEGTELIYPLSAMGAHVSDCPNHIAGRDTKDAGADDDVDAPAFFVCQSMQEKLPVVRLADQILSIFLRISSIFWSSSEITEAHLCNSSLMTAACF